ncbi:tryptophan-rich sensory protein [Alkaliphilus transvaalensis]|uniref:tryptophan-rich sensory protein n=1 Tax=Alkaliphilus transvaalensis TaxID=114628 RepID=UPI000478EB52|nr:tryptophan-rich sensory protein [Alkaliphilus transvaalensis]
MRKNYMLLQVLNIVFFIMMILVNWLANRIPIGGYTTGEVSSMYPNLFTPAPITFAIWGVIYFLLGLFIVYQGKSLVINGKDNLIFIDQIGIWFIVSCIANISWILAWHNLKIPLSMAFMLLLLFSIIKIYQNLNIGRVKVDKRIEIYVHLPFQVYLGWIVIATIANLTTLLVYFGLNGLGTLAAIWTIAALIFGTIVSYRMLVRRRDTVFCLVVLWAYLGIIIHQLRQQESYPSIIITAILCMTLIVFFLTPKKG